MKCSSSISLLLLLALVFAVDKYDALKHLLDEITKADNLIIPLKQVTASK
jgi:hypothetical protein